MGVFCKDQVNGTVFGFVKFENGVAIYSYYDTQTGLPYLGVIVTTCIVSGGTNTGLIAELITCTTNDELQSNNLIGAAVWSFGSGQEIRHINMQGITFNSVTGTIQDTEYNGYFVDGNTYVVLYNY